MKITQVNKYTRVVHNPGEKVHLAEAQSEFEKTIARRASNYLKTKKRRSNEDQAKLYKKFVRNVFEEKEVKVMSEKEFNLRISEKFNGNTTFYRKRMIEMGYISEENFVVKPLI